MEEEIDPGAQLGLGQEVIVKLTGEGLEEMKR